MKLISRIDKISAWILALCFLIYVITGFDSQLRFLSPAITSLIHLKYLFIVAQLAFMVHTTFAMYLMLKRKRWWTVPGKTALGAYLALNVWLFILYFSIHLR